MKLIQMKGGIYDMKKITSLFMMAFLLIGTLGLVVAEEDDDAVAEPKKIGFFSNQMWKIGNAFTFDKEKKIDRMLEMAEKRLAEAELLAEEDPEGYAKAQERYDEIVARAEEILAGMEDGDGDEDRSVDYMERIARIQNKFERHEAHIDKIYDRAYDRFVANNASEEKLARFEMFYERAMNRSDKMEDRLIEKRENAIRKHKALSEMSEEELDNLLDRIEDGEGLTKDREERFQKAEYRVEKKTLEIEERFQKKMAELNARLNQTDLTEAQRLEIEKKIQAEMDRFAKKSEEVNERAERDLLRAGERFGEKFRKLAEKFRDDREDLRESAEEMLEERRELAEERAEDLREAIEDELESRIDDSDDDDSDDDDSEDDTSA